MRDTNLLEERENRDPEDDGVPEVGGAEGKAQWLAPPTSLTRCEGGSNTTSSSGGNDASSA